MSITRNSRGALLPCVLLFTALWHGARAHAATVTVTTTAASGPGSFAAAVVAANKVANTTIAFALQPSDPGLRSDGAYGIEVAAQSLSKPTVIDGTTQTKIRNTNANGAEVRLSLPATVKAPLTVRGVALLWRGTVVNTGSLDLEGVSTLGSLAGGPGTIQGQLSVPKGVQAEVTNLKVTGTLNVAGFFRATGFETAASTVWQGDGQIWIGGELKGVLNLPATGVPGLSFPGFTLVGTLHVPDGRVLPLTHTGTAAEAYSIAGGTIVNDGTIQFGPTTGNSGSVLQFTDQTVSAGTTHKRGAIVNNGSWLHRANAFIGGANGRFVNKGQLTKTAGLPANLNCGWENSGTVSSAGGVFFLIGPSVQSGVLAATATNAQLFVGDTAVLKDGTQLRGTIEMLETRLEGEVVAAGRTTLSSTCTALPSAHFSGSGEVIFDGVLQGTFNLANTPSPSLQWGGAVLTGTMNVPPKARLSILNRYVTGAYIDRTWSRGLRGGLLNNAGTIAFQPGQPFNFFYLATVYDSPSRRRTSTWNNNGTVVIDGLADVSGDDRSFFNNSGSLQKTGAQPATFTTFVNNSGSVEAKEGNLEFGYAGVNSGLLKSSPDGTLALFKYQNPVSLRAGTRTEGNVWIACSRLEADIDVRGTLFLGDTDWPATRKPTLESTAQGRFSGTGTVRWVRGSIIGTLALAEENAARFQWEGGTLRGTLVVPAGGKLAIAPSVPTVAGSEAFTAIAGGTLRNSGLVEIQAATRLDTNNNAAAFLQSGGETRLDGAFKGPLKLTGGVLSGTGVVEGNLTNSGGTVSPAGNTIGTLKIAGVYAQSSVAALRLDVAGGGANQYDVLTVTGKATLGGALQAVPAGGFTLSPNDKLRVLNYAARSGAFKTLTPATAVIYNADHALLTGVAAPAAIGASPASSISPVALSSARAASDGTITLVFTGPVADSATDATRYDVTQNGEAVAIISVGHPRANEIILHAGDVGAGARLGIAYRVTDTRGRAISGATTVTVR